MATTPKKKLTKSAAGKKPVTKIVKKPVKKTSTKKTK